MTFNPLSIVNISQTALALSDPLNHGLTTTWQAWGVGTSQGVLGFTVIPAANATNSYGGYVTNNVYNLTGRYCMVYMQQPMTRQAGAINTLQLQIDANNYLEVGLVDASLMVRTNVAGVLTTRVSVGWPAVAGGAIYVLVSESSGTLYFYYASTSQLFTNWQFLTSFANPLVITSVYVALTAGTYQPLTSTGVATWNSLNHVILPSASDAFSPATISPQVISTSTLSLPGPTVPLTGTTQAQASFTAGDLIDRTPRMTGVIQAQATVVAQTAVTGQGFGGTTQAQGSSTGALSLKLVGPTTRTQAISTGLPVQGPALTGTVAPQAKTTVTALLLGTVVLPNVTSVSLATSTCQALILTRYPLSGVSQGQGATTTILGQLNAVIADLGIWPAGAYEVKTCCRTDVVGTAPVALVFAVMVGGSVAATVNLYTPGDTSSSTYPTVYAQYDGRCSFNLLVPADVQFQWSNPGTYHNVGKHIWIKGAQLHRLS